ncbi:MAG: glucuronate isomerase [Candidatus Marinimicrobia bacterium]|nr:glucuronate isomerase [Candidatus Neomarinimicrobiota bacterium]
MTPIGLDPVRYFDSDPAIRRIASELYAGVKELPILSPHGHTDPAWFAENEPFPDPAKLLIIPDHYIFRMLYSQGVSLEKLGINSLDGKFGEPDPEKVWGLFAENYYLFAGTPVANWFDHVLHEIFDIPEALNAKSGNSIYTAIDQALKTPEFLPRNILDRFKIEVIATTDDATHSLAHHQVIRDSDWKGRVIPTFRPDAVTNLAHSDWAQNIHVLGELVGYELTSFPKYISALEQRRAYFKSMGATATDHGVTSPYTNRLSRESANDMYQSALSGKLNPGDDHSFSAHMLMEMARMSTEDGLVMQIHPGVFRNHNSQVFHQYGTDKGADIPIQTEYTHNLYALLNEFGNDTRFNLIIFTLDETNYSRELAPLAGHYPALKLGPAWWFNDSIEGMTRFRQMTTETASIYNTVGFNDDTRALLSIPARHDLSRRVDSNYLAGLVATHRIEIATAREMSQALAYDLAKSAYNL